jgi:hypothetical protein
MLPLITGSMMTPHTFIIILNWNGKHHLEDCLGSLSSINYPNYKIALVDNDSQDGSVPFVRSKYPHVHIIQNDKNLGFAEGNNVGIRYALSQGAEYVVLLNNDTRVEPDFLIHLIQRGEEAKEVGVLGGKVLMFFNPCIVNSTGVNLNQFAYGWDRDFGEEVHSVNREPGEVLAVTGSLMAIKREVFEKIGFLDPKFFAYFEDVDFCIRVWKHTDFKIKYVPQAVIYHKFSASVPGESSLKRYLMLKNQYRIFFKHFPLFKMLTIYPLFSMHRILRILNYLRQHDLSFFFIESFILLKYWILMPLLFLRHIPGYMKGSHKRFWDMVIPEMNIPSFKAYSPGYERIVLEKKELKGKKIFHRIIMGVNDEVLGEGWSQLHHGFPRIRRMGERSVCFLRNEKGFGYLQIHGLSDSIPDKAWLEIMIEGQRVGRKELAWGWNTYIVPFENDFQEGPVEVQLQIKPSNPKLEINMGFGVNEVGLSPLGSPMLRWIED